MKSSNLLHLRRLFANCINETDASIMKGYMRNQFEFFGIKKPMRLKLGKQFYRDCGVPLVEEIPDFVKTMWQQPERELQYFGNDILEKTLNKLPATYIHLFEYLITHKSWWDTVDTLSIRIIGGHFKRYPSAISPTISRFVASENKWLNRTSITFQLKYKGDTDVDLLFYNIRKHQKSTDFFLQKAIGWALREYSKTDPEKVLKFVEEEAISDFSKKEALKWLKKRGGLL